MKLIITIHRAKNTTMRGDIIMEGYAVSYPTLPDLTQSYAAPRHQDLCYEDRYREMQQLTLNAPCNLPKYKYKPHPNKNNSKHFN